MKATVVSFLLIFLCTSASSQPSIPDSSTRALWHLDESSGSQVLDASLNGNHGTALGTAIVPGQFGNARQFNGFSDHVYFPNPLNGSFNFLSSESFSVEAWFKTSTLADTVGEIVRRGLAPLPGFALRINHGRVEGIIGNREDSVFPDTLLRIRSSSFYNDGQWHHAKLVRDRVQRRISLYVDGSEAAAPINDNFPYALSNTRPLTIGKWENNLHPTYFHGVIDEVRIRTLPASVTTDTIALWRFNEHSGSFVIDSSPYGHHGTAFGTTIVSGIDSNARFFNGSGDYVVVPNSPFGAFNFGPNQSFTISAWFKTTQTSIGHIVRRGLAPVPGYDLRVIDGRVQTEIGNREDGLPPDTVLRLTSTGLYNDGEWHHAMMVRDRERQKLYLYVDGVQAAPPVDDPIPFALSNERPLAIGRWENNTLPTYFQGTIDEVYIFRGARHPAGFSFPDIQVSPESLEFGRVLIGQTRTRALEVANVGGADTLIISGIAVTNSVFSTNADTFSVPPGAIQTVVVQYAPQSAQRDTGSILITSNDPDELVVRVGLSGGGFTLGSAPVINTIRDIPGDQGKQVRVVWYRSIYDGLDDSLHVTEYGLWRRVGAPYDLWDYIARIPAVEFEQYAYVAPTLRDSTTHGGIHWSVFRVSAHTVTGPFFFSEPDSGYSVDNLPPQPPLNVVAVPGGTHVALTWDPAPDPDLDYYVVHRGMFSGFVPSSTTIIGTTHQNGLVDPNISGHPALYYRIVAVDSSGNPSDPSEEASVYLVGVGNEEGIPNEFALHQNYPNPFNPASVIRYDLPRSVHVSLKVYDILGREVAVLVNEWKEAGRHRISWDGSNSSSGIYIYRIQAGNFVQTEKMVLIK